MTPETHPVRFERLVTKFAQRFNKNPEEVKDFVAKRMNKRYREILCDYFTENNIPRSCEREKKCENFQQNKMRKLAFYFNKDQNDFADLVRENPDARFRQLLKILKEKGTYDFDPSDEEAIQRAKQRFKKEKRQVNDWIRSSKILEKTEKKQEFKAEEKQEKPA